MRWECFVGMIGVGLGLAPIAHSIALAECADSVAVEWSVGVVDAFTPPSEPATPKAELGAFIVDFLGNALRNFDDAGQNLTLGHTFTGLPNEVCAATLELHLRGDGPESINDSISLEFLESGVPGQTPVWAWTVPLSGITGPVWSDSAETTVVLDLADLTPDSSERTNILEELTDGDLDLMIDDDTSVDYAILRVWIPDPTPVVGTTWGRVKRSWSDRASSLRP